MKTLFVSYRVTTWAARSVSTPPWATPNWAGSRTATGLAS